METQKSEKFEKEYIIPLREKIRVSPRFKKTPKAVKTIKEFLVKHMKVYDRDLNKIKIDKYLNEYLWFRGIRKPPYKVKVRARKEGEIVKVELVDLPEKLKFKKAREEKREQKGAETAKKKKEEKKPELKKPDEEKSEDSPRDDSGESKKSEDKDKDGVEDKKEESEKKSAVVEAGEKYEKAEYKKQKHLSKTKTPAKEREEERTSNKTY